jgi:hypothetical protein
MWNAIRHCYVVFFHLYVLFFSLAIDNLRSRLCAYAFTRLTHLFLVVVIFVSCCGYFCFLLSFFTGHYSVYFSLAICCGYFCFLLSFLTGHYSVYFSLAIHSLRSELLFLLKCLLFCFLFATTRSIFHIKRSFIPSSLTARLQAPLDEAVPFGDKRHAAAQAMAASLRNITPQDAAETKSKIDTLRCARASANWYVHRD